MNKKKKLRVFVICAAVLIAAAISVPITMRAIFVEAEYTHVKNADVENATLIVGSHLIHLGAVNDEIYKKALDTQQDSGNEKIYYKSELAGGQWYEITDATSVADISTDGTPVDAKVIEGLWLRWHTKKDKVTYDLLTGGAVSIFDTNDPYDYLKRPELQQIKNMRDNFIEMGDLADSDEFSYNFVKSFYEYGQAAVHTAETDQCDAAIDALQAFYEQMAKDEATTEKLNFINKAQASVNALREVLIMNNIAPFVDLLNSAVNGKARVGYDDADDALKLCDSTFTPDHPIEYDDDGNPIEAEASEYVKNDQLIQAVATSTTSMEDTVRNNQAKVIGDGVTVVAMRQSSDMKKLMENAVAKKYRDAESNVDELVLLENIAGSIIAEKEKECKLITDELVGESMKRYRAKLAAGENSTYVSEKKNSNTTQSRLDKLLNDQIKDANGERGELEFLITGATDRMEPADAVDYLQERIDQIPVIEMDPKDDDFNPVALNSIKEYENWLKKKQNDILASMGNNLLDNLYAEREEAYLEKQTAYDNNDLNGVNKADTKIKELDARIEAAGGNDLGIGDLLDDALEAIEKGNVISLKEALDALNALSDFAPNAVCDAMNTIADAGEKKLDALDAANTSNTDNNNTNNNNTDNNNTDNNGGNQSSEGMEGQSLIDQLNAVIDEMEGYITQLSGSLDGKLSKDDFIRILEEALGDKLGNLSDEDQASALIALNRYADEFHDQDAKDLVESLAGTFFRQPNKYIYPKYLSSTSEFIPLLTLSKCTGYRYVFDNTKNQVTLAKEVDYFRFSSFSDLVERPKIDKDTQQQEKDSGGKGLVIDEKMDVASVLYSSDIWIGEVYSKASLGFEAVYLIKGDYAVCADEPMMVHALALYQLLLTNSLVV